MEEKRGDVPVGVPRGAPRQQHPSDSISLGSMGAILRAENDAAIEAAIRNFHRMRGHGPQPPPPSG